MGLEFTKNPIGDELIEEEYVLSQISSDRLGEVVSTNLNVVGKYSINTSPLFELAGNPSQYIIDETNGVEGIATYINYPVYALNKESQGYLGNRDLECETEGLLDLSQIKLHYTEHQIKDIHKDNYSTFIDFEETTVPPPPPPQSIEPTDSFPQGTSSDLFLIIYHKLMTAPYGNGHSPYDVNSLNLYANEYIQSINPNAPSAIYYAQDSVGIYCLLEGTIEDTPIDNEQDSNGNYKVYVGGESFFCGMTRNQNPYNTGNLDKIQLSNGYIHIIDNIAWLFLLTQSLKCDSVEISENMLISFTDGGVQRDFLPNSNDNVYSNIYESANESTGYWYSQGEHFTFNDLSQILNDGGDGGLVPSGSLHGFNLSNTIRKIEYFYYGSNIQEFTVGSGLEEIGEKAFYNAQFNSNVNINFSNVKRIGEKAFYGTSNLNFNKTAMSVTIDGTTNFITDLSVMPHTLEQIGEFAFQYSSGMKGVDFRRCETSLAIGKMSFANCPNLHTVVYKEANLPSNGGYLFLPPSDSNEEGIPPKTANSVGKKSNTFSPYIYIRENYDLTNARSIGWAAEPEIVAGIENKAFEGNTNNISFYCLEEII